MRKVKYVATGFVLVAICAVAAMQYATARPPIELTRRPWGQDVQFSREGKIGACEVWHVKSHLVNLVALMDNGAVLGIYAFDNTLQVYVDGGAYLSCSAGSASSVEIGVLDRDTGITQARYMVSRNGEFKDIKLSDPPGPTVNTPPSQPDPR